MISSHHPTPWLASSSSGAHVPTQTETVDVWTGHERTLPSRCRRRGAVTAHACMQAEAMCACTSTLTLLCSAPRTPLLLLLPSSLSFSHSFQAKLFAGTASAAQLSPSARVTHSAALQLHTDWLGSRCCCCTLRSLSSLSAIKSGLGSSSRFTRCRPSNAAATAARLRRPLLTDQLQE